MEFKKNKKKEEKNRNLNRKEQINKCLRIAHPSENG